ncbi:MAG: hypothetical protein GY739_04480 [Mesoflavibacter sp.]|nr:hypothetical protein [Mesoflavibacter sp.]
MINKKNSFLISILTLVIVLIGFLIKLYDLKTMVIVLISILIGGYLGNRIIKK